MLVLCWCWCRRARRLTHWRWCWCWPVRCWIWWRRRRRWRWGSCWRVRRTRWCRAGSSRRRVRRARRRRAGIGPFTVVLDTIGISAGVGVFLFDPLAFGLALAWSSYPLALLAYSSLDLLVFRAGVGVFII